MFFNIEKIRRKRLINWAKEYKIDLPKNPDELIEVTVLNMRNKGVERIPKEIDCLPNLTVINAEMNKLADLPWEFGKLKMLTSINLSHNRFTDIPGTICKFSQVENLNMESNGIKKVPSVIANMTGLKTLNLAFNTITELPAEIGHLKHLAYLDLASNKLTSLPASFHKLYNLNSLVLWNNKFDSLPEVLKELPNLSKIQDEPDLNRINMQLIFSSKADNHFGVELALMHGADINFRFQETDDKTFTTALFEAHSEEMVRYLIEKGADINLKRPVPHQQNENITETFLTKKQSSEITKFLKSRGLIK